jgi:hypothetical protein
MMKTVMNAIFGLTVILMVMGLIGGGLYWTVQSNPGLTAGGQGGPPAAAQISQSGTSSATASSATQSGTTTLQTQRGAGGDHEDGGINLARGLPGTIKNVGVIAILVLAVAVLERLIGFMPKKRSPQAAP